MKKGVLIGVIALIILIVVLIIVFYNKPVVDTEKENATIGSESENVKVRECSSIEDFNESSLDLKRFTGDYCENSEWPYCYVSMRGLDWPQGSNEGLLPNGVKILNLLDSQPFTYGCKKDNCDLAFSISYEQQSGNYPSKDTLSLYECLDYFLLNIDVRGSEPGPYRTDYHYEYFVKPNQENQELISSLLDNCLTVSCYTEKAIQDNNIEICNSVPVETGVRYCKNEFSKTISDCDLIEEGLYQKERCYIDEAVNEEDISICDKIDDESQKYTCISLLATNLSECSNIPSFWNSYTDCQYRVIYLKRDLSVCEEVVDHLKSHCYYTLAIIEQDKEICENINDNIYDYEDCINESQPNPEFQYKIDNLYHRVASYTQNTSFCEYILEGNKEDCISEINSNQNVYVPY
jgi:hypothetical protein